MSNHLLITLIFLFIFQSKFKNKYIFYIYVLTMGLIKEIYNLSDLLRINTAAKEISFA